MIKNGNYKWLNFDKIKPMMKQVFIEYYGDNYSDNISKIIDDITYLPMHKFDYVNEYYRAYIIKFKNEILNNFFEISKINKSDKIRKAMFPDNIECFDDAPINLIMGAECRDSVYNQIKAGIEKGELQHYKTLLEAFDLDINDKSDTQCKLHHIIQNFIKAIKKVEQRHPCDVFTDMQTIESNFNDGMVELIKKAEELKLPVSEKDKNFLLVFLNNRKVVSFFDYINSLDIARDYFDRDLQLPGLVSYFSTKYEEKLSNSKDENRYSILVNRLRYLYNQGAQFEVVDKDEVLNFTFTNGNMQDLYKRLEKEYKIQCIKNPQLIVPQEKADLMEMKRLELLKKQYDNCKFKANLELPTKKGIIDFLAHENAGALMSSDFVNDIYHRDNSMIFDEGLRDDAYAIICAMCHEINHAISNKIRVQDCYSAIDYMGLVTQGVAMEYGKFIKYITDEPDIEMLYENINQRQAKEIAEIYFENYDTKEFSISDIIIDDEYYDCKYEFADFLTKDFYNLFYEELKQNNVDTDYDIYYDVDLYCDKKGKLMSKAKSKIERLLHKKEYFTDCGTVDFHKVSKLGALVTEWLDNHMEYLCENEISAEDLVTGEALGRFDYKMYKVYQDFISRKDAIIKDMFKDKEKTKKTKGDTDTIMKQEDIDFIRQTLEDNNLM